MVDDDSDLTCTSIIIRVLHVRSSKGFKKAQVLLQPQGVRWHACGPDLIQHKGLNFDEFWLASSAARVSLELVLAHAQGSLERSPFRFRLGVLCVVPHGNRV